MRNTGRILRNNTFVLFSIFLLISCNTSHNKDTSKRNGDTDTTKYIPKDETRILLKNKTHVDTVFIKDMKFQPEEINVHKGDTLVWINQDLVAHCVTEVKGKAWTSGAIHSGASWKKVVTKSSDYYCAIHPEMKGRIVLK